MTTRRRLPLVVLLVGLGTWGGASVDPSVPPANQPVAVETNGGLIAERLPRVEYLGGPFLRNPLVTTVTFAGDDPTLATRLEGFGDVITRSPWWREVTDGYCVAPDECVGEGSAGGQVRLDVPLPHQVSEADVEDLLIGQAHAYHLGELAADTLLLVYLPSGVTLTDPHGRRYCVDGPRAFHRTFDVDGGRVAYAVMPRCGTEAELTTTASHEILEAVTNPDPHRRGFAFQQDSSTVGFTFSGVEPVDPCGLVTMDHRTVNDGGYTVQRAWSNRAAGLGRAPCVPAPADQQYVALVPREPVVRVTTIGGRATVVVDAAADRPVPGWSVSAVDLASEQGGRRCVDVDLDKAVVSPRDTVRLTITLRHRDPPPVCVVGLVSTIGTTSHQWPLAISTS